MAAELQNPDDLSPEEALADDVGEAKPKGLFRRVSLSVYLTTICTICAIAACVLIGYYAYDHLKVNKFRDAWAIAFLELEKQVGKLSSAVSGFESGLDRIVFEGETPKRIVRPPDIVLKVDKEKRIRVLRGSARKLVKLRQFGIERIGRQPRYTVLQYAGRNYLTKFSGRRTTPKMELWEIDLVKEISVSQDLNKDSIVYLITRQGKLIYTNNILVTADSITGRPLVQEFINVPVRQGQIKFLNKTPEGEEVFYGFYSEVPDTNLILFAETPEGVFVTKILEIAQKFSVPVAIIIIVVLVVLQLSLRGVSRPIRELVGLASEISKGNFNVRSESRSFGEINTLSFALSHMAESLVSRDESIRELMSQQAEKVRLEGELEIAKEIQENLLPERFSESESKVEVQFLYRAAETVAGDWYGTHTLEESNEFLIAIADVSGHGAGPSLFTAIITAVFEEYKLVSKEKFKVEQFYRHLNKILKRIGKGKWHATMQIAVFSGDRKSIDFYNCGHNFPLVIPNLESERKKVQSVKLRSTPLGIEDEVLMAHKKEDIGPNDTVLLYTDGLIEAKNRGGMQYGIKRLVKLFERTPDTSPKNMIRVILREWESFSKGTTQEDDICLLAIRTSA